MPSALDAAHSPPQTAIDEGSAALYSGVLHTLAERTLPFLVGGAFALAHYTGIERHTKDLDLFIHRDDFVRIRHALQRAGYHCEMDAPHWLAKVLRGSGRRPDLQFGERADSGGRRLVRPCAARQDPRLDSQAGASGRMHPVQGVRDGARALRRSGCRPPDPRLRCSNRLAAPGATSSARTGACCSATLVLFGFIYPGERELVPTWVLDELCERLLRETQRARRVRPALAGTRCRGSNTCTTWKWRGIRMGGSFHFAR